MGKIRVLHCIETISSGGVEQVRLTMISGLDKRKYDHKIICTWAGGPIAEALKEEGVEVIVIGGFKHPFQWSKHMQVLKVIREFKPHIIHGAVFEGMSMAAISGSLARVPVRILEETSDPTTRSQKAILLQRVLVSFADKIIGISPKVCEYLSSSAKIPLSKIHLINNGVRIPKARLGSGKLGNLAKEIGLNSTDIVVGGVGRIHDNVKRFSDVLKALQILSNPKIKFLLVGDGPDLDKIKTLATKFNLTQQLISVGYKPNPELYYPMMDILCVPSANEGFGLVAVEAMLHRLPVIASKVGGLENVVIDGVTGFLIPPLDPHSIAEKLDLLVECPEIRKSMGEKGEQHALLSYTADHYCREIDNLYQDLLIKKGILNSKIITSEV